MKVLVVAHPDDEALWFNPGAYDRIVICFLGRRDNPAAAGSRRNALMEHPLDGKIICLNIEESNHWREQSLESAQRHNGNLNEIIKNLKWLAKSQQWTAVDTHSAMGEYGHADHKLVFRACMEALDCPVNGKDPALYREIKRVYVKYGAWTWDV